jgi:hypothetical protein
VIPPFSIDNASLSPPSMNSTQDFALPRDAAIDAEAEANSPVVPRLPSSWLRLQWQRRVLLVLLAVFFLALGYSTVYRTAWNDIERTDFTVYTAVGQAVLDGTDIYQAHNARGWFYVYPPTFSIFMPLFTKLPLAWGSGLWYLLSLLAVASASFMSLKLARAARPNLTGTNDSWILCEIPFLLASPWLVSGLMRCQASEFMVWLMIAAVYFSFRGRPVLGGMSLAAAVLIKAFPLALLAYFVLQRQWRLVGACFFGLLLGGLILPAAVFGWQKNLDYWATWGGHVAGPAVIANQADPGKLFEQLLDAKKPRNQSLESLLLTLDTPQERVKPLLGGMALAMLAAMAWGLRGACGQRQLLLISAFLCWDLLIPPISETHYFGLLLLPLAMLTAIALDRSERAPRRWALAVLILVFVVTLWTNLDKAMEMYRLLCWTTLAVWACLLGLAFRSEKTAAARFESSPL